MDYIKIPYIYGGNDPATGLDCSGLVMNVMRKIGLAPLKDTSSQGLFQHYSNTGVRVLTRSIDLGDLLFFGNKDHIHHVALGLNSFLMLEAGHGDSSVTSVDIAQKRGAYVMVSPISKFKDLYAVLRPSGLPW